MAEKGKNKIITILTICIMIVSVGLSGCVEEDGGDDIKKNHSPVLIIKYPTSNYGFDFYEDDVFIIKWKASDIDNDNINIDLFYCKDNKTWNNISLNEENDGEYHWQIDSIELLDPDEIFGTFYLKIIASDGKDKTVKIVHTPISFAMPNGHHTYLKIISPNGNENWSGVQNITWDMNLTGYVEIKILLINKLENNNYIITDFISIYKIGLTNDSLFFYEIDTTNYKNGDKYLIHIEIENEIDDISDGFFSIYN